MNKGELVEVFKWLSGTGYQRFDAPGENMVNVWYEVLKDVPEGYALKGVKDYTSVVHPYERFPLPANIKEAALSLYKKDVESSKAQVILTNNCFERCLAVFPGAYHEDVRACRAEFYKVVTVTAYSPYALMLHVENHVRDCEINGRINEVGTLTDFLKGLADGHKG